jgi:hypothetical protein
MSSTDGALSGIGSLTFAVELNERADQNDVLLRRITIIAFERPLRLGSHIGTTSRKIRIQRIAKILGAFSSVGEIRDTLQIAATAVTCGNRMEGPFSLADNVKSPPELAIAQIVRARCIHGKIAGVLDDTFLRLSQVKRACPLQDYLRDLPVAFANRNQAGTSDDCSAANDPAISHAAIVRPRPPLLRKCNPDRNGSPPHEKSFPSEPGIESFDRGFAEWDQI